MSGLFYNAFCKSTKTYSAPDYGATSITSLEPIEKAQRSIIRAMFSKKSHFAFLLAYDYFCMLYSNKINSTYIITSVLCVNPPQYLNLLLIFRLMYQATARFLGGWLVFLPVPFLSAINFLSSLTTILTSLESSRTFTNLCRPVLGPHRNSFMPTAADSPIGPINEYQFKVENRSDVFWWAIDGSSIKSATFVIEILFEPDMLKRQTNRCLNFLNTIQTQFGLCRSAFNFCRFKD